MKAFVILSIVLVICEAKVFQRCELAEILLRRFNFKKAEIADWVCLVEHESTYNTAAVGHLNSDKTEDFGLFQINNGYWCAPSPFQNNVCGIQCQQLLDDDISDDVKCVRVIFKEHGFTGWNAWTSYCRDRDLSQYIQGCNLN